MELDVHLEGVDGPIGRLSRNADSGVAFQYTFAELPYPLSLALPVREAPFRDVATRGYFENLIFENRQREAVMERHGVDRDDIVGLLSHLGGDCPGAVSIVPRGEGPAKAPGDLASDYDPIEPDQQDAIIRSLRDHRRVPDEARDPSPLAGVQGKLAVTRLPDGRLAQPRPDTRAPTTHILKVPKPAEARLVDHEHLCMRIAADVLSHPVAQTEIVGEGDLRGLLVERFDRTVTNGRVHRVHQEDFCQALGLGPGLKYQRNGLDQRMFSAQAAGRILAQCNKPGLARQGFLEATIVNLALGNTDNHAKNHALLYRGAAPDFAPLYDVVPVILDDGYLHQMSFDIGGARMTDEIRSDDVERFAEELGMRRLTPAMARRLAEIVDAITARISDMSGPERKRLGDAMAEQCKWLAHALPATTTVPARDLVVIQRP